MAKGHPWRTGALLLALCAALLFGAGAWAQVQPPPTWTVLFYVVGSNLESEAGDASQNLSQILSAPDAEHITFVMQTGGAQAWHNDFVAADRTQRFVREGDAFAEVASFPARNMGKASVLQDFITWGMETYPADHVILLLWDHGGGAIEGFGADEHYGLDALSMAELQSAFQGAKARTGQTLALVGFDACLMASAETALALSGTADFLVASAEYEPASGWDYHALLTALCENPYITPHALATGIADAFYAAQAAQGRADSVTLSVTDLSLVPALGEALTAFAAALDAYLADTPGAIYTLCARAGRALSYGGSTALEGFTDMLDLKGLAQQLSDIAPEEAQALADAVSSAVCYQVAGWARSGTGGLSIYWPLRDQQEFERSLRVYDEGTAPEAYRLLVRHVAEAILAERGAQHGTPFFAAGIYQDEWGWYHAQIDPAHLNRVERVFFTLGTPMDETHMVILGEDYNLALDPDTGDIREGFNCYWFAIDGRFVMPTLIEITGDQLTYAIPALLDGQQVSIRASFIWTDGEGGHYELHGAWPGIDAGTHMPARERIPLTAGQVLTPLYALLDLVTGETRLVEGLPVTLTDATMTDQELVPGTYAQRFGVSDALGTTEYTPFVLWDFGG